MRCSTTTAASSKSHVSNCGSEYFKSLSSLRGHRWWEATVCRSWLCGLASGYCRPLRWHKLVARVNHNPATHTHAPLLLSRHEYLNAYTYMHTTRPAVCLTWPQVKFELSSWGNWRLFLHWNSRRITMKRREEHSIDAYMLCCCFLREVTEDTKVLGCIHANASPLADRWHTSRPICSFTSTIKIHGSIFLCPVCQRCSVFFSVKWIKWAGCQRKCSFQTPDISAFLRLGYVWTEIWSDGFFLFVF